MRRTDAEAEASILRPPDENSWLTGKDPDAGKGKWRGGSGYEIIRWHHQLNGHEFEQIVEDRGAWCATYSPWGRKELEMTKWLNNNKINPPQVILI